MNSINCVASPENTNTFPGYLFSQYVVKPKDSNKSLALLSILDKTCVEASTDTINHNTDQLSSYLSELRVYDSDEYFDILKGISDMSIDVLDIRLCPILHTVIPHKSVDLGIIGSLSECPEEESISWSLVAIK